MTDDSLLWQVRHFVYRRFADTTHPPSVDETARHFNIDIAEASRLYKELHNRHAFFLEPDTLKIRMANPFSGVPTSFKVHANGKAYDANCAWDMLGIPVALDSDAVVEAVCTESNDLVQVEIRGGKVARAAILGGDGKNVVSDLKIHFPLPFARWYDDLVFT